MEEISVCAGRRKLVLLSLFSRVGRPNSEVESGLPKRRCAADHWAYEDIYLVHVKWVPVATL